MDFTVPPSTASRVTRASFPRLAALITAGVTACAAALPLAAQEAVGWRDYLRVAPAGTASGPHSLPDWRGFYLGADLAAGGNFLDYRSPLGGSAHHGTTGTGLGLYGGYNWRMERQWLIGLEAQIAASDLAHRPLPGFEDLLGLPQSAELALRAGPLTTAATLVYARLGLGGTALEGRAGFEGRDSAWQPHSSVGVGVETRLSATWNARMELRQSQLIEARKDEAGSRFDTQDLALHLGLTRPFGDGRIDPAHLPPYAVSDWTGWHAGVGAEIATAILTRDIDGAPHGNAGLYAPALSFTGGYDHQIEESDWVVGAALTHSPQFQTFRDFAGNALTGAQDNRFAKVSATTALALRVGYLVQPETLVYASLGRAQMDVSLSEAFYPLDGGGNDRVFGSFWGLGVETPLWERVTLRIEAQQLTTDRPLKTTNNQDQQVTLDPEAFTARLSLNWRW